MQSCCSSVTHAVVCMSLYEIFKCKVNGDSARVHSLETGTLTFWCLPHIVADLVKIAVHPALCDPCNYSLPHLRPKKLKNREIETQPGYTKLGQVCLRKMY